MWTNATFLPFHQVSTEDQELFPLFLPADDVEACETGVPFLGCCCSCIITFHSSVSDQEQMGKVFDKPEELGGVRSGSTFGLLQLPVILALLEEQTLHGAGVTFQGRRHF